MRFMILIACACGSREPATTSTATAPRPEIRLLAPPDADRSADLRERLAARATIEVALTHGSIG